MRPWSPSLSLSSHRTISDHPPQWGFTGISTFAHLPHVRCLTTPYEPFDIGIIGAPFDTAVSYRPGILFPQGNLPCFRSIFSCICVPISHLQLQVTSSHVYLSYITPSTVQNTL